MVNKLVPESGSTTVTGSYDYGQARMWIPQETTITAEPITSGEARYISNSGVLAIYNGTSWTTFSLRGAGMPPDHVDISGAMASWADETPGSKNLTGSGVTTWFSQMPGTNAWVSTPVTNGPDIASGVKNGFEAVYFDGTAGLGGATTFYNLFSGNDKPCTMFAVCRPDFLAAASNNALVTFGNTANDTQLFAMEFGISSQSDILIGRRANNGGNAFGVRAGAATLGQWTVVGVAFDGTSVEVFQDAATVFASPSGMNVNTCSFNTISLGEFNRLSETDFFTGFIGEVVMYTSGLSPSAMSGVSSWLMNKWAI